ncbi:hypothetical protein MGH68_06565 [Erysipelothrix sp. D19-032]
MARRKAEKKTSSITRFSFKSSFIVMFGILASTLGFPLLLDAFGLQLNFLRVIVIGVTSVVSSHTACILLIPTKECKKDFGLFLDLLQYYQCLYPTIGYSIFTQSSQPQECCKSADLTTL